MTNKYKHKTNILFPRASFLKGLGSVLNISGNYYIFNYSDNSLVADLKAIKSDWGVVGQDIKNASEYLYQNSSKQ